MRLVSRIYKPCNSTAKTTQIKKTGAWYEQRLLQRRYINGQYAQEKVFNINSHLGKANQTKHDIKTSVNKMATIRRDTKVLARMCKNWKLYILLVE